MSMTMVIRVVDIHLSLHLNRSVIEHDATLERISITTSAGTLPIIHGCFRCTVTIPDIPAYWDFGLTLLEYGGLVVKGAWFM